MEDLLRPSIGSYSVTRALLSVGQNKSQSQPRFKRRAGRLHLLMRDVVKNLCHYNINKLSQDGTPIHTCFECPAGSLPMTCGEVGFLLAFFPPNPQSAPGAGSVPHEVTLAIHSQQYLYPEKNVPTVCWDEFFAQVLLCFTLERPAEAWELLSMLYLKGCWNILSVLMP